MLSFSLFFFQGCLPKQAPQLLNSYRVDQLPDTLKYKESSSEKKPNTKIEKSRSSLTASPNKAIQPKKQTAYTLKKVEDNNFDPEYMYPDTPKQHVKNKLSEKKNRTKPSQTVSKEECLSLIGETKFRHYTEMLGSEAAALKRCALLKAID
jgi:hypothetical protein